MAKFIFLIFICILATYSADVCKVDSDCLSMNSCINGICVHKHWASLMPLEILGTFLLIILAVIATAGGVGGSVVCTSFSLLLFDFESHEAVAMTQAYVFAATFTVFVLKFNDRHPKVDRPLLYYDVMMQITSPLLLGVSIGVMLNPVFPSWLLLSILTLVVAYLTYDTIVTCIKMYKKESALKAMEKQTTDRPENGKTIISQDYRDIKPISDFDNENNKNQVVIQVENPDSDYRNIKPSVNMDNKSDGNQVVIEIKNPDSKNVVETNLDVTQLNKKIDESLLEKVQKIKDSEKKPITLINVVYFLFLIAFSIVMSLLRGTSSTPSIVGAKVCSGTYFGVLFVYIIVMIGLGISASFYLIKKYEVCLAGGYQFDQGDIKWNKKICFYIFLTGVFSGILVGLVGLGGGYIIGPILLHLGVRPEVTTLCSSFVIWISSFTAMTIYFAFGVIDWQYALWYMMLAVLGAIGGVCWVRRWIIKIGRSSLLIMFFTLTLIGALIIIPTTGIMTAVSQSNKGTFQLGFTPLCK